jgi:SSS family solute:Na+ symporter
MSKILIIMVIYWILTVLVAYFSGRGAGKSVNSFLMADRGLSMPVYSLTYMATFTGGGLVMGLSTLAYNTGISAQWYAMTEGFAFITICLMIPFLRKFKKEITVPELLGKFFGANTKYLASLITLVGNIALTAGQCIGMASLVTIITGLPLTVSLWISTLIFILITFYGGLKSVAWADVFHGITLSLGIVILIPIALYNAGGWGIIANSTETSASELNWFGIGLLQIITWYFMYVFVAGASQFMVQRVWAARSTKAAVVGTLLAGSFVTFFGIFTAVAGMLAKVLGPADLDSRLAFAWTLSNLLPEIAGGILLAAATAAVMSGADSFLLAASTTFVNDIYAPLRGGREKCSDKELVLWSRISIFTLGVLSALIALSGVNIVPINTLGMGVMAAPIFVCLMYAMWRKTVKKAAFPSIIVGGIVFSIWEWGTGQAYNIESAVPAAVATGISIFLISKFSQGSTVKMNEVVEKLNDEKTDFTA